MWRTVGGGAGSPVLDTWLYLALLLGSAAVCLLRPLTRRGDRLAWAALGTGLLLYGAGNLAWTLVYSRLDPPPLPSPADVLWLSFYPCAYVTVTSLLRQRAQDLPASVWLDGLTACLAVGAVGSVVVLGPVLGQTDGATAQAITLLAYPVTDIAPLGLLAGVLAVLGWHPGSSWTLPGLGLAAFAVADFVYVVASSAGLVVISTVVYALWAVGIVLLGLAPLTVRRSASWPTRGGRPTPTT